MVLGVVNGEGFVFCSREGQADIETYVDGMIGISDFPRGDQGLFSALVERSVKDVQSSFWSAMMLIDSWNRIWCLRPLRNAVPVKPTTAFRVLTNDMDGDLGRPSFFVAVSKT